MIGTYHGAVGVTSEKCRYGDHPRQKLTVHRRTPGPCDPPARPAVVAVHGGYWNAAMTMKDWPERLAGDTGYTVLEMGYRLNTDAPWPAPRDDVHAVLAWAARHAEQWGIDPQRLALVGSSAGGHLAASAAVTPTGRQNPAVRAVVALSPPLTPHRAWKDGERPTPPYRARKRRLRVEAARLADCTPDETDQPCWDTWQDMAVGTHAHPANPPMWLGYFAKDLVPDAHGRDYRDAQAEAGAPSGSVTLLTVPGGGHAMTLLTVPAVDTAVRAFLTVHLAAELPRIPAPAGPPVPRRDPDATTADTINL